MMIFQSEDDQDISRNRDVEEGRSQSSKENLFLLTQQHKINLNKRLPRGFCLIKKEEYERLGYMKTPNIRQINYEPVRVIRQVDLDNPIIKTIDQAWSKRQQEAKKNSKFSFQFSMQGRSRQSEKIKNIIQRFRKLIKNTQVQSYLNKVGLMMGLNQIETENRKGMLTIDTFKARYMLILQTAKNTTFELEVVNQIDQMIEEFMCYVQQARKAEFENNIQSIQKSIDKITRYLSDAADGKTQGNWYIRKKKKGQRNDISLEKQVLYFADLVKKLPPAYLVGIWEIINDRPFCEADKKIQSYNLNQLSSRKLRDIESYVKSKLSQLFKSRQRKKEKILAKKQLKQAKEQERERERQKDRQQKQKQVKKEASLLLPEEGNDFIEELNKIFEGEEQDEPRQSNIKKEDELIKKELELDEQFDELIYKNQDSRKQIKMDNVQQNVKNNQVIDENDSMDINNSSDSSMITDEDDSDF